MAHRQKQQQQQQPIELQWLDEFLVDASSSSSASSPTSNQKRETRRRRARASPLGPATPLATVKPSRTVNNSEPDSISQRGGGAQRAVAKQPVASPEMDAAVDEALAEEDQSSERDEDESEASSEDAHESVGDYDDCQQDASDCSSHEEDRAQDAGEAEARVRPRELELERVAQENARHCDQLQSDLDVLAAHLEAVTQERGAERAVLERELRSSRVEVEALRRENALLAEQSATATHKLAVAVETHEQLLLALTQQQQHNEQLQASNHVVTRDRAAARRALEAAQLACRRLEEELVGSHAQLLRLQDERRALEAALQTAAHRKADSEAAQLQLQDEMIRSLRADLLQMGFEFKTLRVDKEALEDKVARLERRRGVGGGNKGASGASVSLSSSLAKTSASSAGNATVGADYDVISLATAPAAEPAHGKKRATIRPLKARGNDGRGSMFGSLLDLPNYVGERQESAAGPGPADGQASHSSRHLASHQRQYQAGDSQRELHNHAPGIVSRMAKAVKKRFGAPSAAGTASDVKPH